MSEPRARVLNDDGVTITRPAGSQHYFIPPGGILVQGTAGDNVDKVWIRVLRLGAEVPADPSQDQAGGWVVADVISGEFSQDSVRGAVPEALVGSPNNKVVAIPQLLDGTFGNPSLSFFLARPAREELVVSARHCLWFAFADPGLPGPGQPDDREADTANHKPPLLSVPENASALTYLAQGRWRHHHPVDGVEHVESDADGRDNTIDLQNLGYRSQVYNSQDIGIPNFFRLNSLIGMWVNQDNTPVDAPFVLGSQSQQPLQIPPNAASLNRLCLAFHDGKRWHNNSGFMTVSISWIEATNRFRLRRLPSPVVS